MFNYIFWELFIFFIPHLGAISRVLGPWGKVSNTDHGGSRIFRRSDWLYHSEQMGPIWGSVPCQKNLFCVWNKLFLGEIKFSQRRTRHVKSLWWQIFPMQQSTNEGKNLTFFQIMGLRKHNGKTSNSEVPIDKINIEILEIFQILKNIARFNLK